MKLKKCIAHGYTLKENCPVCSKPSKEAHYKFVKVKSEKISAAILK